MKQSFLPFEHELVIDLFAGGGGASEAMRLELGREPDIAINHDPEAISLHAANHPHTKHYREDIYAVDPIEATRGRPVGLLHASPDCTDHSQAKGGQPRRREIRALSWVVLKWAGKCKPRCITLENVEQILKWGPLIAKRDPATGRVVKIDGTVAARGERVPLRQQFLVADPKRQGQNWRRLVNGLRDMGYVVEWRKLRASDYGAGTSRERLFLMARRDGLPIVWPKPTHGKKRRLKPLVTAAQCIDWSIPCPSIFDRERPLAESTLRRIARGIQRFIIDSPDPFIVPGTHHAATMIQRSYGERRGQAPRVFDIKEPFSTFVAGGLKHAIVVAYLEQANTGMTGHDVRKPISTIVGKGCTQRLVTATLSPEIDARAERVAAFMIAYYNGGGQLADLRDPMPTLSTRDRLALVTVTLRGVPYVIVDIGMRLLTPRELFRAQGFPETYIIDRGHDGRPITKTAQVRMVGNSVSPPPYQALLRANFQHEQLYEVAA